MRRASQPRSAVARGRSAGVRGSARRKSARLAPRSGFRSPAIEDLDALRARGPDTDTEWLFEACPAGIARLEDRRIVSVNRAFARCLGMDAGQIAGASTRLLYESDRDWEEAENEIVATLRRGEVYHGERRARRPDGARAILKISERVLGPAQANLRSAIFVEDLTDRHRRERELRMMLESAPLGVLRTADGRVIEVNSYGARVFGYSRGELIGLDAAALYADPLEFERSANEMKAAFAAGRNHSRDTFVRRKLGGSVSVRLTASPADWQDPDGGELIVVEDITRRRSAEHAAIEASRRYERLVENLPAGLFETDAASRVVFANPRWHDITGLQRQTDLDWARARHPDDAERASAAWRAALATRAMLQFEERFVHPDGSIRRVITQASPLLDGNAGLRGYVGFVTDVTGT